MMNDYSDIVRKLFGESTAITGIRPVSGGDINEAFLLSLSDGSRIFLKEKLSWKHYASIAIAAVGIIAMGIMDP
jgi:fructosamine-3-kinase